MNEEKLKNTDCSVLLIQDSIVGKVVPAGQNVGRKLVATYLILNVQVFNRKIRK